MTTSLAAICGFLLALAGSFLLVLSWPPVREPRNSRFPSAWLSVFILACGFVLYLVAYGALRGSLIALFMVGAIVLAVALGVELHGARRGSSSHRG